MNADVMQGEDGVDYAFIEIDGAISVCVPNSMECMSTYVLREQGDWFEDEIRFLRSFLSPGMSALDIGANFGVYALTMAKVLGPSGRVWAFEPASDTAACLRKSVSANGFENIDVVEMGVSDEERTAPLYIGDGAELNTLHGHAGNHKTETVQLTSLDAFMPVFGDKAIDFVKLDAEGEEGNIIRGGKRFFAEQSPLVMFEVKHGNTVNLGLIQQFEDCGYKTYRSLPGLHMLVPYHPDETPDAYQLNLFCCKDDQARQLATRGFLVQSFPATVTVPDDADDFWRRKLALLPYGRFLIEAMAHATEEQTYYQALSYFFLAKEQETPCADRYALLQMSKWLLDGLVSEKATLPRLISHARVSAEIGAREDAVGSCAESIRLMAPSASTEVNAPFLAIDARFEGLAFEPSEFGQWLLAGIIESHERLRAFSSYFTRDDLPGNLDWLASTRFLSEEMARRRQFGKLPLK